MCSSSSSLGTNLLQAQLITALEPLPVRDFGTDLLHVPSLSAVQWAWAPRSLTPHTEGSSYSPERCISREPWNCNGLGLRNVQCKPGGTLSSDPFYPSSVGCFLLQRSVQGAARPRSQLSAADTHFFTCSSASGSRRHAARSKATESSAVASVRTSGVYPTRIPLQGKHRSRS